MARVITLFLLLSLAALSACETPIELPLEVGEPTLVIDAQLNDIDTPACRVRLTKTQDYFANTPAPTVSGATVIVSDELGTVDTLEESPDQPGLYLSSHIEGVPRRRYELVVEAEGQRYIATARMRRPTVLDTAFMTYREKDNVFFEPGWYITVAFQDSAGREDNRLYQFYKNDTLIDDPDYMFALSDALIEGRYVFFEFTGLAFEGEGDTIRLEMSKLDDTAEDYYDQFLDLVDGSGGPFDPIPTNPITNIEGGALGLFMVASVQRREMVLTRE